MRNANMMHTTTAVFAALLFGATLSEAAKILAIFPIPSKSHTSAYRPLMEELAQRGHEITVITPFPRSKPLENYTEIITEDTFPQRDSKAMNWFEYGNANFILTIFFTHKMFTESCEKLIKQPKIQMLIHDQNLKFDLIFYVPIGSQCTYGLLHKLKVPSIQIIPNTLVSLADNSMGNPNTLSYIPDLLTDAETMDFKNRLLAVVRYCFTRLVHNYFLVHKMTTLVKENYPDPEIPNLFDLESNASLLFIHSHPILSYPRPLTPNTIEVGGLHIKSSHKLPQDLQKYLDEATSGVIFFSLGSNVRGVDMPDSMRNALLKSFSKLKQKILWKWEADKLPGQPKNVQLSKWLPQQAILAHPNVKLFITHGGLMSTQESTYFGVPMIAIPVMGDQKFNAQRIKNNGHGVLLEVQNITEESFHWALQEVLHKPNYREKAKLLSKIFQDQPQRPLDRAVFWTEYVIRHKGAPHLHSAAVNLNFFQYYLIDVIATLFLLLLFSLVIMIYFSRLCLSYMCSKSRNVKGIKKEN